MKFPAARLTAFASLLLAQVLPGQSGSLLVHTDVECRWSVDGEPQGVLKTGDRARLSLSLGEHRVEAVPVAGGPRWEETVKLSDASGQELAIPLRSAVSRAGRQL